MLDIIIANVIFWTVWISVSSIPFWLNQYAIDNYEKMQNKFVKQH